uniref:Uncharacterized protein n=1 Tax=Capra hircus TaxID=9925 RepID=A0A8C2RCU7_CAPHI
LGRRPVWRPRGRSSGAVGAGGDGSAGLDREPSLYTIKAVFILDNDGHRLLAKVTSHPHRRAPEDTVPQAQV